MPGKRKKRCGSKKTEAPIPIPPIPSLITHRGMGFRIRPTVYEDSENWASEVSHLFEIYDEEMVMEIGFTSEKIRGIAMSLLNACDKYDEYVERKLHKTIEKMQPINDPTMFI